MLKLEVQALPHLAVLRCSGRIVHGDGADDLLRAVMSQSAPQIQIDLSEVELIDAAGLGALVAVERWAEEQRRSIQLVHPSDHVRGLLEATRLNSVLQVRSEPRGEAA